MSSINEFRKRKLLPMIIAITLGLLVGISVYTFLYARGISYLSDDPTACANCHIMNEQYNGWVKSSHHGVAVCNDCHTPHDFLGKYFTKGLNGFNHSWAFTTGWFHEPININERNRKITEDSCIWCHEDMVHAITIPYKDETAMSCTRCHDSVGHIE